MGLRFFCFNSKSIGMQLDYFLQHREQSNLLIPQILKECNSLYEIEAFRQYYPKFHDVNSLSKRPDKTINVPIPNSEPNPATGEFPTQGKIVPINRTPLAIQKLLVSRKTAFVTGGNVALLAKAESDKEERLLNEVQTVWKKNKLQFKNSDIFKRMVSETECAEIWYSRVNDDKTIDLRVNIYSPANGYSLYPVFNGHEDLIAFGLGYDVELDGQKTQHLDIYDNEYITRHVSSNGGDWTLLQLTEEDVKSQKTNPRLNPYGKIPVIYYQSRPAWEDVQMLINRLETLISNFGDVNDYNGSPILFAEGDIDGFSSKGETGKVIQSKNGGKLSYVSWDHAPESIKLEIETLQDFIYTITQTPNISFKEMQGLGSAPSGAAMDRMFIDAHLNAKDYHNGAYGEGIQRRINFLQTALISIYPELKEAEDLDITANFSLFSLSNDEDKINIAMKANGNLPVMSHKASVQYTGLTDDAEATIEEIKKDKPVTPINI